MTSIILILFFLGGIVASNSTTELCGDKVKTHKGWVFLCITNPNQNLQVIFDCGLNPYQDVRISIRNRDYPSKMESMTIQNCEKITLTLERWDMRNITQNRLHLLNISLVELTEVENRCLPQKVIFENVGNIRFSIPLISDVQDCEKSGMILESLELINTTIKNLNRNFIWENVPGESSLTYFVMENGTVENVESDSIFINNKKCVIEIKNSTFGKMEKNFISGEISEIALIGNAFNGFFKDHSLLITADKVSFTGNNIGLLGIDSLYITSNNIEISDNIFHHIEEKAFRGIKFLNDNSPKYFQFSNNVIYSIAPDSVTPPIRTLHHPFSVDNITIYNNSIRCHCSNFHWFDSVFRKRDRFYYKWSKKSNLNKCINIPNCNVKKVLTNYEKLCEQNYDCLKTDDRSNKRKMANSRLNEKRIISWLMNLEKCKNETFRNFSKSFDIIIDKIKENREIFKNLTKLIINLERSKESN